jgi:NosR/NirI family nitrous oxide reductase transcriptional regulator
MIQVRLKREKFERLSSPATRGPGPAPPVITHRGVAIEKPDPAAGSPN